VSSRVQARDRGHLHWNLRDPDRHGSEMGASRALRVETEMSCLSQTLVGPEESSPEEDCQGDVKAEEQK
jgi:hypothetical protein